MPAETLQLNYSRIRRSNHRKQPVLTARQVCARFLLILIGLALLIAVLMKLGVIQEQSRTIYVAQAN